jgi:uncharacterized YccA/Bax inhibitor family protein
MSNPVFSEKTFENYANSGAFDVAPAGAGVREVAHMTVRGAVNKTFILLALVVAAAGVTWSQVIAPGGAQWAIPVAIGGAIGAFILALVTSFRPQSSGITAPIYAVLEGLFFGAFSAIFERIYPGIVMQAVGLTFGVLGCMLLAYQSGLIRATDKFKVGVLAATGAVCVIYLVSMVLRLFGTSVPLIHESGPVGIIFSLVVVGIAALNLILDFDLIEEGARMRAPRFMEWYSAFGLTVTLLWLYLEVLKLLAKLQDRD